MITLVDCRRDVGEYQPVSLFAQCYHTWWDGMSINALHARNTVPGAYAVVDIAKLTDENAFR
jgi:hypothetical protein